MNRHWIRILTAALLVSSLLTACAPPQQIVSTLTLLPGTPTPIRPTRSASVTAGPTNTIAPVRPPTKTPAGEAAACPPFSYDTELPSPDEPQNYVGKHYSQNELPQGLLMNSSGLLENDEYAYVWMDWHGQDMVWIQRMVCRDVAGVAHFEIVASMALPKMSEGQVITQTCFQGDQMVPFAIAYGKVDQSRPAVELLKNFVGWPMAVEHAWQMKETFIPLETAGLTCMLQVNQGM